LATGGILIWQINDLIYFYSSHDDDLESMGIANFAAILLLNYRKQQGHYCHDILAMLAEWEEEMPKDVAHLDISKVYDLGGTRNSKNCKMVLSFLHTIN